jgi:hypothetical protein
VVMAARTAKELTLENVRESFLKLAKRIEY